MFYQKQVQKLIGTSVFGLGMMIANSQNAIALTVPGSLPRSEEPPPTIIAMPPSQTTFDCIQYGPENWATIPLRNGKKGTPIIVWTPEGSSEFGGRYTPHTRCQIVTNRLTEAVRQYSSSDGRFSSLLLTIGSVNGRTVICFVNNADRCNEYNMLFTLKQKNANQAGETLAKLLNYGRRASSGPVFESGGGDHFESGGAAPSVRLEDVVNASFGPEGVPATTSPGVQEPTQIPSAPSSQPSDNSEF